MAKYRQPQFIEGECKKYFRIREFKKSNLPVLRMNQ